MLEIRVDDCSSDAVHELLAMHLGAMRSGSPPGHCFALNVDGLRCSTVTVWTAWRGSNLAGRTALRGLNEESAERKSVRTHPDYLRQGVAAALLERLVAEAKARASRFLCLETGTGEAFEPALGFSAWRGFRPAEAFGDYPASAFNQFLQLDLADAQAGAAAR